MQVTIEGKYQIIQSYGPKYRGSMYVGKNIKSNDLVAIKLEQIKTSKPQLQYEAKII